MSTAPASELAHSTHIAPSGSDTTEPLDGQLVPEGAALSEGL